LWRHVQWHEAADRIIADQVGELRAMAAHANGSHLKGEVEAKLREMTALQQDGVRAHADTQQMYRQTVMTELELDRAFREGRVARRRQLAEARAADRHRVLESILAETPTMDGNPWDRVASHKDPGE
jgi:hypothetical protein